MSNHPRAPQPRSSGTTHTRCMKSLTQLLRGHTRSWAVYVADSKLPGAAVVAPLWPFWSGVYRKARARGPGASEHSQCTGSGLRPTQLQASSAADDHQLPHEGPMWSCHAATILWWVGSTVSCMWRHVMSHAACIL